MARPSSHKRSHKAQTKTEKKPQKPQTSANSDLGHRAVNPLRLRRCWVNLDTDSFQRSSARKLIKSGIWVFVFFGKDRGSAASCAQGGLDSGDQAEHCSASQSSGKHSWKRGQTHKSRQENKPKGVMMETQIQGLNSGVSWNHPAPSTPSPGTAARPARGARSQPSTPSSLPHFPSALQSLLTPLSGPLTPLSAPPGPLQALSDPHMTAPSPENRPQPSRAPRDLWGALRPPSARTHPAEPASGPLCSPHGPTHPLSRPCSSPWPLSPLSSPACAAAAGLTRAGGGGGHGGGPGPPPPRSAPPIQDGGAGKPPPASRPRRLGGGASATPASYWFN